MTSTLLALVAVASAGDRGRAARAGFSPGSRSLERVGPSSSSATSTVTLRVEPAATGPAFAEGAVGLSIEAAELGTQDLSAADGTLVALMRLLGPGVLRIGGNSVDRSWWTGSNEPRPAWATNVVTPADLVALRGLLLATHWRAILGVDLGHFDPSRAANEAYVATRTLGSGLLGFEVGNEPDGYDDAQDALRPSGYGSLNYLLELATYTEAMRTEVPAMRLYGPDVATVDWLESVAADNPISLAALTLHFYPTTYGVASSVCRAAPAPSALRLLSPQVRALENTELQALAGAGRIAHRATRIDETNTTQLCNATGASETGPVFASALWALDWALRAAKSGASGINFHGWLGACAPATFSPICLGSTGALAVARPEYYGLLAARQLEGGHFIPVKVVGQVAADDFAAYATRHGDTVTLAVDNFASTGTVSVSLQVPGYARAAQEALAAPSINSTDDVTLGGASLGETGGFRAAPTATPRTHGRFQLQLAPASAYIVTLHR